MAIKVDNETNTRLKKHGQMIGSGKLPFPAISIRVRNGKPQLEGTGGIQYFGGWEIDPEKYEAYLAATGLTPLTYFKKAQLITKEGKKYEAYASRFVLAKPICYREAWWKDGQPYDHYVKGAGRTLQMLSFLANLDGKKVAPWGTATLEPSGFQCDRIGEAVSEWAQKTKSARMQFASGAEATAFYIALGSFGEQPVFETVGKPGKQNTITPIKSKIPDQLDEASLENLFLGNETLNEMLVLEDQAEGWRTAKPHTNAVAESGAPEENPEAEFSE